MAKVYIVDPTHSRDATCGLMPGTHYFRARRVKDGPLLSVKTQVIEPRDPETDEINGDVRYIVEIDGKAIPFAEWHGMALFGEEVDEITYKVALADDPYCQAKYGARPGEKPDLRTIPFVEP